jgi:Ice-binding-like
MAALDARALRGLLLSISLLAASFVVAAPAADAASPAPVNLGGADPFAILAGTAITDVPNSVIAGNVGLSPTTGAAIGVTCSEVTGTIYSVDLAGPLPCRATDPALLTTAKNNLTAAYTDVAGRTPVTTVPTELGGTTKIPGVYDSASTTFGITAGAGPLILDAQGDPNGVFIFEMGAAGTGLTAGPGSQVQLTGGAQACNVFWRLTSATLDTTSVFKGNILALTSITVNTGANVEGRLLARNGQVSLQQNTITRSVCAATPTAPTAPTAPAAPAAPAVPAVPRFTG